MTTTTTAPAGVGHRPAGALLATVSLIAGPALIALALATLTEPWIGNKPDYAVIENQHGQLLLSFNLAAAAFPFLYGSVVALSLVAARSRWLAGTGLACSMLGLAAMAANAMLSVPLVLMNGIGDHAPLDELAIRLDSPPLVPLWLFPLFFVGSLLQAVALWRSRAVPAWSAVCVGVGGLFPVAILTGVGALALPIAALRIAGSIPVIKNLLAARTT